MSTPSIETNRLKLRPFSLDDVEPLLQILNTQGILRYFPISDPPDRERVRRLVQRQIDHWLEHSYGWWAVELLQESRLIGWSGLQYLPETDEIEIGYLLGKQYWGNGLATESAKAGLEFGFNQLGFQEIIGIVHPENFASQRVLEKIGLKFQEKAEYFGMVCFKYLAKSSKGEVA
jgi:ribosomal-protein-alanine N-acetyltransferase